MTSGSEISAVLFFKFLSAVVQMPVVGDNNSVQKLQCYNCFILISCFIPVYFDCLKVQTLFKIMMFFYFYDVLLFSKKVLCNN